MFVYIKVLLFRTCCHVGRGRSESRGHTLILENRIKTKKVLDVPFYGKLYYQIKLLNLNIHDNKYLNLLNFKTEQNL